MINHVFINDDIHFGKSPSMGVNLIWEDFEMMRLFSPFTGSSFKVAALTDSSIYLSNPVSNFAEILVSDMYGVRTDGDDGGGGDGDGGGDCDGDRDGDRDGGDGDDDRDGDGDGEWLLSLLADATVAATAAAAAAAAG